jgi:hypothetical protein
MAEQELEIENHNTTCELCHHASASDFQGGVVDGERKLWYVCKSCKKIIHDQRYSERRMNSLN